MTSISVIGAPSSAGSYTAGQDLAPSALRAAGLIEALEATIEQVRDEGDLERQIWRPDRSRPRAQNLPLVVEHQRLLADRVESSLGHSDAVLVLGGSCLVVLGVLAALRRVFPDPPTLLYIDRHYDLNTPQTTTDGALDWMGMAHALDLDGVADELASAFGPRPLIDASRVAWLGVEPELGTTWERDVACEFNVTSSAELVADPAGSTRRALAHLPDGPLAVHIDVDVLDFTDAPLAENTDGRNSGPTLDQAAAALRVAMSQPRLRVLSVGELNPTRSVGDPDALPRFVATLAQLVGTIGL